IYIWGILPVEARLFVLIMTALALYSGINGSRGGVADFAHLGGFAGGWLYLLWLDRKKARPAKVRRVEQLVDKSLVNWRKVDPKRVHEVNRDELNRILDKINRCGLDSLTPQERIFLSNFVPKDDRVPPPT